MNALGRPPFVAATLAAAAAVCGLVLAGPPLLWLALAIPLAYCGLLVAGVMHPRLGMFARVVWRGPRFRPEIALTFDDGPDPTTTPKILATLAAADARATFFVLGAKARRAPQVLREMAAAGHAIGIHGDTHDRRLSLRHPDILAAGLERNLAGVEAATGFRPSLFRPPLGHVSPRTAAAAKRLGLTLVAWSVRSRDGLAATSAAAATRRVLSGLRPGAIVLMHDAAEHGDREPASIAALPAILDEAKRRGLRCVTLPQMQRS
ncbi:MAG: polysaccharide deacetylase family protein [Deltaproteobacteria bacterium]|nr:polysaccharide deacetylase family protein [Deltaproteobacteria bacterium]